MQNIDDEVWKPVPVDGLSDMFEVSSHGRVRRSKPIDWRGRSSPVGFILKQRTLPRGYKQVALARYGRYHYLQVHRLVLWAFVGPPPSGFDCCHGDGNPANNHVSNLRWDTRLNNIDDTRRHGRINRGERNGHARLTESDVLEIRRLFAKGMRQTDIAVRFGVRISNVNSIVWGRSWRHLQESSEQTHSKAAQR